MGDRFPRPGRCPWGAGGRRRSGAGAIGPGPGTSPLPGEARQRAGGRSPPAAAPPAPPRPCGRPVHTPGAFAQRFRFPGADGHTEGPATCCRAFSHAPSGRSMRKIAPAAGTRRRAALRLLQQGHKLFAGDGFLFQQIGGEPIHSRPILFQKLLGPGIGLADQGDDLLIHPGSRIR